MEERNFSSVLFLIVLFVGIFGLLHFLIKAHLRRQLVSFSPAPQVSPTPIPTISPIEEKILKMSLEEKIGSLFIIGFDGEELAEETKNFFKKYHFNAFLLKEKNIKDQEQLKELSKELCNLNVILSSSEGSPGDSSSSNIHRSPQNDESNCLIAVDQEGGRVDRLDFPTSPRLCGTGEDIDKTSQTEIKTPQQAYQVAKSRGESLLDLGISLNFSPLVEVASQSSWIADRTFQLESDEVASLAGQMIKGYQDSGIVAVVKHFPAGLGRTKVDPHQTLPVLDINRDELEKDILVFRKLIAGGDVKAVMVTHLLYPKIDESNPSSLSEEFINRILRNDLGFDGVVVSDDLAMKAITSKYSISQAAKLAFLAGTDMILISGYQQDQQEAYETILQAAKNGEISEERIGQSVRRILLLVD